MVKIIDGEIYQDDDPRLADVYAKQRQQTNQNRPAQRSAQPVGAASTGGGGQGRLDFSAPPIRVCPIAPGQTPLFGLPDIELFGFRLSPAVIGILVGLGACFGWKVLVAGAIMFFIFTSGGDTTPISGAGASGSGSGVGGLLQQLQATVQGALGSGGGGNSGGGQQQQQQQQTSGSAPYTTMGGSGAGGAGGSSGNQQSTFAGRGHKLSDKK